jgi:hypothetical protein
MKDPTVRGQRNVWCLEMPLGLQQFDRHSICARGRHYQVFCLFTYRPVRKVHMLISTTDKEQQLTRNAPGLFPSPFFRLSSSLVYRGRLKTEWHVSRAIAFVWKDGSKEGTSTTAFAFQLVFLPTIRNATGSEIRYLDLGRPRSLSFGVLLFQGLEVSAQPKVEKPNQKLGSNLLSRIRGSSALV